jgi:hypothetical protein
MERLLMLVVLAAIIWAGIALLTIALVGAL